MRAIFLAFLVGVAASCDAGKDHSFFSLDANEKHEFSATYKIDFPVQLSIVTHAKAPTSIEGREVIPVLEEYSGPRGSMSSFTFYEVKDDGVYEVARQGPTDVAPRWLKAPRMRMPASPQVGQKWASEFKADEIGGLGGPKTVSIPTDVVVDSLSETVSIPFGSFENCLLIVAEGSTEIDVGGLMGKRNFSVSIHSWYAPGVGLVKQIIKARGRGGMAKSLELSTVLSGITRL